MTKPGYLLNAAGAVRRFGVGPDEPFTWVAWVRVPAGQTETVGVVQAVGVNWFEVNVTGGRVEVVVAEPPQDRSRASGPVPPPGAVRLKRTDAPQDRWYHLAVTRSAAGEVRLYFDGSEGPTPVRATYTGGIDQATVLGLGYLEHRKPVAVALDECALFDRVLAGDELLALAGRKPLPYPPLTGLPKYPAPRPWTGPRVKGPPREAADPAGVRGLTFHLPCEEMERGVKERVSGLHVGRGWDLSLVPGVRGRALRTHVSGDSNPTVVQDGFGVMVPAVVADRPFALALWSRWSDAEKALQMITVTATQTDFPQVKEAFRIERSLKGTSVAAGAAPVGVSTNGALRDWIHHALVSDAGGAVTLYENGQRLELDPNAAKALGGAAFNGLYLGHGRGECRGYVDDVCLFDRALSADEVLSLAGRGASPRPKEKP